MTFISWAIRYLTGRVWSASHIHNGLTSAIDGGVFVARFGNVNREKYGASGARDILNVNHDDDSRRVQALSIDWFKHTIGRYISMKHDVPQPDVV